MRAAFFFLFSLDFLTQVDLCSLSLFFFHLFAFCRGRVSGRCQSCSFAKCLSSGLNVRHNLPSIIVQHLTPNRWSLVFPRWVYPFFFNQLQLVNYPMWIEVTIQVRSLTCRTAFNFGVVPIVRSNIFGGVNEFVRVEITNSVGCAGRDRSTQNRRGLDFIIRLCCFHFS